MSDIINILNTIRDNATAAYIKDVPLATRENFQTVGSAILNYSLNNNEFVDALVNQIALTQVRNNNFTNPLTTLKKGGIPLGQDIQEIYTNPATSVEYDGTSTELLQQFKPDTNLAYYRMNRQAKFRVTVRQQDLRRAFTSINAFDTYLQSIITSMYSGDEIEQFELTKQLISQAYDNNSLTVLNINTLTNLSMTQINALDNPDEYIAKWLVKNIKTYSSLLTFPSTNYNQFQAKKGSGNKIKTWTPKDKQILILPSNVNTNMDVEVLAYAFNLSKQQINTKTLEVDSFNGAPILGILCDESCFQIYENGLFTKSFDNGDTLAINYYLHHWQTYGFSLLANSIVFTYSNDTVSLATGSLGTIANQMITGLTANTTYNVSVDGEAATSMAANASGQITGLSNDKVYYVTAV